METIDIKEELKKTLISVISLNNIHVLKKVTKKAKKLAKIYGYKGNIHYLVDEVILELTQ